MEGDEISISISISRSINGSDEEMKGKILQTFENNFEQVQKILDQNRLLVNQIHQNHASNIPENLRRNVGLIRLLNDNLRRVVDLYADLSSSFAKSAIEASSKRNQTD